MVGTHFRLAFAHLAFCAAAILARPSVLTDLRFRGRSGIPRLSGGVWSVNSARIFSRRLIASSMSRTISSVFTAPNVDAARAPGDCQK